MGDATAQLFVILTTYCFLNFYILFPMRARKRTKKKRAARRGAGPTLFLKEGGTGILFRDPLFPFLQERVPAVRQAG